MIPKAKKPVPRTFLLVLIVGSLWWFGMAQRAGPAWGIVMAAGWMAAIGIGAYFVGYDSRDERDWRDSNRRP